MKKEMYSEEVSEDVKKEIGFLYDIGVSVEELDYLLTLKMNRK